VNNLETLDYPDEIAIIGMACRFPGARNTNEFWQNLCDGVESVSFFSDEELLASGVDPSVLDNPNYVRATAILEDVESFDAPFFDLSPKEAEILDPQHRLFMECSWETLESAGYNPGTYQGSIGVYAGKIISTYLLRNLYSHFDSTGSVSSLQTLLGNEKDYFATYISYKLNLKGPSVDVQTACSTSLVAVHLACQSLLNHECDMALAGGITIRVPRKVGYLAEEGGIVSSDGHCRAFDAKAGGSVPGNGVGVVLLKRLAEAVADRDHVYAVIKGSAINNDGASKIGYTAPSEDGQAEVISEALVVAGVEPETITYIEAHGTGTPLGDPIEIAALTRVFRARTHKKCFCAIGSVKTNIGHLETASGIAGLIKTILALEHKLLPPSLHFEQPNPHIDFVNSPFYVNAKLSEWEVDGIPRLAGVSSFGMGGTNAHVVLGQAPVVEASGPSRRQQLLLLSAKTESALARMTENLVEHLRTRPSENLADVAYTLHVGRDEFDYRRMVVCRDLTDAIAALEALAPQRVLDNALTLRDRSITFMFPGLGDQYVGMATQLYEGEPVFRQCVDHCCELLQPYLGRDLHEVLYPSSSVQVGGSIAPGLDLRQMVGREPKSNVAGELEQTSLAQPAVFVIEYALAQLWMSWGIEPQAMIGYSLGEYVAACLAGIFSLEDGLRLVTRRAQMIETLPAGDMLAVALPEDRVKTFLGDALSLSGINGPMMCVVSGPPEAITELEQKLAIEGVACRQVQTLHAFHSRMMEPVAASLTELVQTIELGLPQIPYISNVTGTWITTEQATDPNYWAIHLRQPVRFAGGVQTLWREPGNILLEVGIGQTLGSLAMQHPARNEVADPIVLSSLPSAYDQQPDIALLLRSLGQLWLAGVPINWSGFYAHEQRQRRSLPTYPFERQRYWVDYVDASWSIATRSSVAAAGPADARKEDIADWFYMPTWQRMPLLNTNHRQPERWSWLLFMDECGLGKLLEERLQQQGQDVTVVMAGQSFQRLCDGVYTIDPRAQDDYAALIKHVYLVNKPPSQVVHMWSVTPEPDDSVSKETVDEAQQQGFYSLLFLAQALGNQQMTEHVHIQIVSSNMQDVLGGEGTCPAKATLLGPLRVIPKEYEQITCSSIDVVLPDRMEALAEQLLDELLADTGDEVVAYRGHSRWVQLFKPVRLQDGKSGITRLCEKGVYLITGGFGGLGSALAECLAKTAQARLVLVGRSSIPPRETWPALLADDTTDERVRHRIQHVLALESLGAEVLPAAADVADRSQMQQVVDDAREKFGNINGVFHLAGVPGEGLIQLKTPERAAQVLRPKLQGTLVLDEVLRGEALDFVVLYSSINATTGDLGEVDYCAANAFLDAFAHYHRIQRSVPTVSINWGLWQWDVWQSSLAHSLPKVYEQAKRIRQMYGLTFKEGEESLWRVLSTPLPQVLVSTLDLQVLTMQWHALTTSDYVEKAHQAQGRPAHPRPNLRTPYVAPRDEMEERIAEIWAESLAIERVGIHDHFLELGGNSLLGLVIISRLRKELDVHLPATALYEGPTVGALCDILRPDRDRKAPLAADSERGKRRKRFHKRHRRQRA
jgi:acyl transferase domain-containing protein/acyl carrier protein